MSFIIVISLTFPPFTTSITTTRIRLRHNHTSYWNCLLIYTTFHHSLPFYLFSIVLLLHTSPYKNECVTLSILPRKDYYKPLTNCILLPSSPLNCLVISFNSLHSQSLNNCFSYLSFTHFWPSSHHICALLSFPYHLLPFHSRPPPAFN